MLRSFDERAMLLHGRVRALLNSDANDVPDNALPVRIVAEKDFGDL